MTVTQQKSTGTAGKLVAYDQTDDPNQGVIQLYITTTQYVAAGVNWSYRFNNVVKGSGYEGEMFENSLRQYIKSVYVGPEVGSFTFRIENTGTSQLGGPTELTFTPYWYDPGSIEGTVRVKVGEVYKQATPYVKKSGIWQIAKPYVKRPTGWKEAT